MWPAVVPPPPPVQPPAVPIGVGSSTVLVHFATATTTSADYLLLADCSVPGGGSLATGITYTSGTAPDVTLSVDTSATVSGGLFRLCVFNGLTYDDIGQLAVVEVSSVTPSTIPIVPSGAVSVDLAGAGLIDISGDADAVVVRPAVTTCSDPPPTTTSTSVTFNSSTSMDVGISDATATRGAYRICLRASATSPYFDTGLTLQLGSLTVAARCLVSVMPHTDLSLFSSILDSCATVTELPVVTVVDPRAAIIGFSGQLVVLTGTDLVDVSAVPSAFVVAASCTSSTASLVDGTSFSFGLSTVTVDASSSSTGVFRLCMRVSVGTPYFDVGAFHLLDYTAASPATLPIVSSGVVATTVSGFSLIDLASVTASYLLAATGTCTAAPALAVTSLTATLVDPQQVAMVIDDSGASPATLDLCVRLSTTNAYVFSSVQVALGL